MDQKVVLRQECILVLGFRTTLIKGFDQLQMLTTIYIYIHLYPYCQTDVNKNQVYLSLPESSLRNLSLTGSIAYRVTEASFLTTC